MREPEFGWDADGPGKDVIRWGEPQACGADLYVDWSFSVPVDGDVIRSGDVAMWSVRAVWQCNCTEGHRIASSRLDADDPEPFVPGVVLALATADGPFTLPAKPR